MGTSSLKADDGISGSSHGQRRRERIEVLDRRRARLLEAVLAESVRLGDQQQTLIGARRAEATGGVGVPPRRRPRRGEHASLQPASVRSSAGWSAARRA